MSPRSDPTMARRFLDPSPTLFGLVLDVDSDGIRLLLLAGHPYGRVTVCRARFWSSGEPVGPVIATMTAAYHAASRRAPTLVHLTHHGTSGGTWPARVRRSVGPIARLTTGHIQTHGWPAAVQAGMALLGLDPTEDPEHAAVLAEQAATRADTDPVALGSGR